MPCVWGVTCRFVYGTCAVPGVAVILWVLCSRGRECSLPSVPSSGGDALWRPLFAEPEVPSESSGSQTEERGKLCLPWRRKHYLSPPLSPGAWGRVGISVRSPQVSPQSQPNRLSTSVSFRPPGDKSGEGGGSASEPVSPFSRRPPRNVFVFLFENPAQAVNGLHSLQLLSASRL